MCGGLNLSDIHYNKLKYYKFVSFIAQTVTVENFVLSSIFSEVYFVEHI